eukprot:GILJ01004180.1.p1 GENE.GILJ01004180.1~~GILJ01004180.1.p1  ORF type:complete len:792 (-),score=70.36 GILJ01004180.1:377-2752(-)
MKQVEERVGMQRRMKKMAMSVWNTLCKPLDTNCPLDPEEETTRCIFTFCCFVRAVSATGRFPEYAVSKSIFILWLFVQSIYWATYVLSRFGRVSRIVAACGLFLCSFTEPFIRASLWLWVEDNPLNASAAVKFSTFGFIVAFFLTKSTMTLFAAYCYVVTTSAVFLFSFIGNDLAATEFRYIALTFSFLLIAHILYQNMVSASLRAKEQFSSNISHELRTPINGFLSTLDLLSSTPLNDQQRTLISLATTSAENMLQLVDDLLDFTALSHTAKLAIKNEKIYLHELAMEMNDHYQTFTLVKDIKFTVELAENLPTIYSDCSKIRQVCGHFLSNAFKFSYRGGIIRFRISAMDNMQGGLFEVIDDGIGISPSLQRKLFQPFSQISRTVGGTGLGLVISKTLVALLGGEIGIRSELGQGSTFWFTIPVGKPSKQKPTHVNPFHTSPSGIPSSQRSVNPSENPSLAPTPVTDKRTLSCPQPPRRLSLDMSRQGVDMQLLMTEGTIKAATITSLDPQIMRSARRRSTFSDPSQVVTLHVDPILPQPTSTTLNIKSSSPRPPLYPTTSKPKKPNSESFLRKLRRQDVPYGSSLPKPLPNVLPNPLSMVLPQGVTASRRPSRTDSMQTRSSPLPGAIEDGTISPPSGGRNVESLFESSMEIIVAPSEPRRRCMLLAEDNPFNTEVAKLLLAKLDFDYECYEDGALAVAAFCKNPHKYSGILMDCQMPVMDGHEATTQILAFCRRNNMSPVPIIGLTADISRANIKKCKACGMLYVLSKPVRQKELEKYLNRYINAKV